MIKKAQFHRFTSLLAKISGLIWAFSLIVFAELFASNFNNTAPPSQQIQNYFQWDMIVGVVAFSVMVLFAFISLLFNKDSKSAITQPSTQLHMARNWTNTGLLACIVVLLVVIAFLLGQKTINPLLLNTYSGNIIASPTPQSTPQPVYVQQKVQQPATTTQPTASPKQERRKVQYATTQASINGTFYCYDDRVNELARLEQELKVMGTVTDMCTSNAQNEGYSCANQQCSYSGDPDAYSQCSKSCFDQAFAKCKEQSEKEGAKRSELNSKIREICP